MYCEQFLGHWSRKCLDTLSSSHLKVSLVIEVSEGNSANPHPEKPHSQLIQKLILIMSNSYYAGSLTLRNTLAGIPTYGSHFDMSLRSSGSE